LIEIKKFGKSASTSSSAFIGATGPLILAQSGAFSERSNAQRLPEVADGGDGNCRI